MIKNKFIQVGGAGHLLLSYERVDGYLSLPFNLYHSVYKNYDHIIIVVVSGIFKKKII